MKIKWGFLGNPSYIPQSPNFQQGKTQQRSRNIGDVREESLVEDLGGKRGRWCEESLEMWVVREGECAEGVCVSETY